MKLSQRGMQIVLGVLWLLDGLLQFQPYMFTRSFATDVLAGAGQGQPSLISDSVVAMARFIEPHIVVWNTIFASIQVLIGVGLLFRRTVKPTLVASFVWVALVWWFGEGFGQIFGGNSTLISGAPGAVLLYGLIGVLIWPSTKTVQGSISAQSVIGDFGGKVIWASIWVVDGFLQLLPSNYLGGALSSAFRSAGSGEPGLLAAISRGIGKAVADHNVQVAIVLGVLEIAIGLGVFLQRPNPALLVGAILAVVIWVAGQDLGGILTGQGTDPNSGPLYVMLALALSQPRYLVVSSRVSEPEMRSGVISRILPRI
jgi:hypothetical protein